MTVRRSLTILLKEGYLKPDETRGYVITDNSKYIKKAFEEEKTRISHDFFFKNAKAWFNHSEIINYLKDFQENS